MIGATLSSHGGEIRIVASRLSMQLCRAARKHVCDKEHNVQLNGETAGQLYVQETEL